MRNFKKMLLPALAVLFVLSSCGKKAQNGDFALCNIKITCDAEVLLDSSDPACPESSPLPVYSKEKLDSMGNTGIPRNIAEALIGVKKGDVKTIEMLTDTMQVKPCNGKKITYTITVVDVLDKAGMEDYKNKRRAQEANLQDVMRANGEKIGASLKAMVASDSVGVVGRVQAVTDSMNKIAADFTSGANKANFKSTASGLQYWIVKQGTGAKPAGGNVVAVQYYGCLPTGASFDQSFKRGQPFAFALPMTSRDQPEVIKAWDEAVRLLPEGSTAVIVCPPALAYAEQEMKDEKGNVSIPANSTLMFYIEVQKRYDFKVCSNSLPTTTTSTEGKN